MLNSSSGSRTAVLPHTGSNMWRLLRKKSPKLPWEAYSMMTSNRSPFVHAPRRLTMFLCSPTWMRILSSEARSLYSSKVALATISKLTVRKKKSLVIRRRQGSSTKAIIISINIITKMLSKNVIICRRFQEIWLEKCVRIILELNTSN